MRDRDRAATRRGELAQRLGLAEFIAKRLLDYDVEPSRHSELQVWSVAVVGGSDRKRLDAIIAGAFVCDQLLDTAVATRLGETYRKPFGTRSLGARGKHARQEREALVHHRSDPMNGANHGRRRTAYDPEAKRPPECGQHRIAHERLARPSTWSSFS